MSAMRVSMALMLSLHLSGSLRAWRDRRSLLGFSRCNAILRLCGWLHISRVIAMGGVHRFRSG